MPTLIDVTDDVGRLMVYTSALRDSKGFITHIPD